MLSKSDSTGYWLYGWDFENRLLTVRKQNKTVRYQYDALGRRVLRIGKSVGINAKYTYDGLDVILDDSNGSLVKYQNSLGVDTKLKMITNGQAKYFLQDHLGSTVGLTDQSGAVLEQTNYNFFKFNKKSGWIFPTASSFRLRGEEKMVRCEKIID